jgi:hypothetical protein
MIDKELIEILICPKCKAPVKDEGEAVVCTNAGCGLRYPVRDGIPAMLIEEAVDPKETRKP